MAARSWAATLALLLAAGLSGKAPFAAATKKASTADDIKPAQADGVFASTINTMDIFHIETEFIENLNVGPHITEHSAPSPLFTKRGPPGCHQTSSGVITFAGVHVRSNFLKTCTDR